MKKLKLLLVIICTNLILTGCSSISKQKSVDAIPNPNKNKNPITVSIYTKKTIPHHPYQVIGLEAVSKYNLGGIKRQEANIRDTMRAIAAAMGGDAVINLKYEERLIKGTVITYTVVPV